MLNWYFKYWDPENLTNEVGAISTPAIPRLYFAQVRDELIIPYLESNGINPKRLKYERAKNAPFNTKIIEASSIISKINVGGILYDTSQYFLQSQKY